MFDTKRNIVKPSGQTPPAKKPAHTTSPETLPDALTWPIGSEENASKADATPVQGGGDSSVTGGAGVESASSLIEFLKRESEKRDEQHRQLVGSMDTLRNTVVTLTHSLTHSSLYQTRSGSAGERDVGLPKAQKSGVESSSH